MQYICPKVRCSNTTQAEKKVCFPRFFLNFNICIPFHELKPKCLFALLSEHWVWTTSFWIVHFHSKHKYHFNKKIILSCSLAITFTLPLWPAQFPPKYPGKRKSLNDWWQNVFIFVHSEHLSSLKIKCKTWAFRTTENVEMFVCFFCTYWICLNAWMLLYTIFHIAYFARMPFAQRFISFVCVCRDLYLYLWQKPIVFIMRLCRQTKLTMLLLHIINIHFAILELFWIIVPLLISYSIKDRLKYSPPCTSPSVVCLCVLWCKSY